MISVRGLSRCLVNDQQRFARFDHYLAPADFRAFDESVEGLQRANFRNQSPTSLPATATGVFFLGRLSQYLILVGLFIVSPPIERRHTRERIAEKPSRQVARLELGSTIAIRQRQGTGPNARR